MKPMLAAPAPAEGLDFPCYASAKLDGVRCLIKDGRAWSRKLEEIPNVHVQRMLGHAVLDGLDGELCVGNPYAGDVFNRTQSGVMAVHGTPDFLFYVFDYWNGPEWQPYEQRLANLRAAFQQPPYNQHPNLRLLEQRLVTGMDELSAMEEDHRELGYEGLIIRNPGSAYKFGRSTDNPIGATNAKSGKPLQPWCMMKIKRFSDGEARVVGVEEMLHNENDLESNALGLAKRSKAKDGMVPAGVMGRLLVEDVVSGVPFAIGGGFTMAQRAQLWADHTGQPASYTETEAGIETVLWVQPTGRPVVGRFWKYKHFEVGVKTAPRFPVSLGERNPLDMGEPA